MKKIDLFKVRMSDKAAEEVTKVLNSGFIGQGPKVDIFENLLQQELNTKVVPVTTNSCTSAIDLCLDLIDIKAGDEIISSPQTCYASNCMVIHRGAIIRWADIDPITGLIDPNSVEKLITEKTKAIIAVNWAGRICDFDKLNSFGVPTIEDAAHTWDIFPHNKTRGTYTCYSFQAIKFLTCSDGGCIICPNEEKANEARIKRWFGLDRTKSQSFRCCQNIKFNGYKYHMTDLNAVIGIANIPEGRSSVVQQKFNSKYLINNIKNENIILPTYDSSCSFWLFSLHILNGKKQKFIEYMGNNGIVVSPVHFRNDMYSVTEQFREETLVGVDSFSETQCCIPNGWWLSAEDLIYIVNVVNEFN